MLATARSDLVTSRREPEDPIHTAIVCLPGRDRVGLLLRVVALDDRHVVDFNLTLNHGTSVTIGDFAGNYPAANEREVYVLDVFVFCNYDDFPVGSVPRNIAGRGDL